MNATKFCRECERKSNDDSKKFFVVFDKKQYCEIEGNYSKARETIKKLISIRSHRMKSEETFVKGTDSYLTHSNTLYNLKNMGYNLISL
jgi:RNA binding exosome subunit